MTTGLDAIRETIIRQGEEKAEAMIREAEEEKEKTLDQARERAEEERQRILEEAKPRARTRYEEKLGSIRSELKRNLLIKREELIDKAWTRAEDELRKYVESDDYVEDLKSMVLSAAAQMDADTYRVSARPEDLERLEELKQEIEDELGDPEMVLGEELDCIGGVKVSDPEGRIVLDRTYDSRMSRMKTELRPKLANILTEGAD